MTISNIKKDAVININKTAPSQSQPQNKKHLSVKSPPFLLRNKENQVFAGIKLEEAIFVDNELLLRGWVLGFAKLSLLCDGIEVSMQINRFPRQDMLEMYSVTTDFDSGFEIRAKSVPRGVYGLQWHLSIHGKNVPVDFSLQIEAPSYFNYYKDADNRSPVDGFIRDWAAVQTHLDQPNNFDLFIDEQFISCIEANVYRGDLKDTSNHSNAMGFLAPVPLVFCDNKKHRITLKKTETNKIINTKELKLNRIKHLVPIKENIIFDQINTPFKNHKKIFFLAGYSNQPKLLNYQNSYIRAFQQSGFYVVYILATNEPRNVAGTLNSADRVIVRKNLGYDFGSWATAFQLCHPEFLKAKEVIWGNDSIIGPIYSIDSLLEKIEKSASDIWAITDSQDKKYHFQSYLWGMKKKANQFQPVIDAFFFYRYPLPKDKDAAINQYEIEALNFFKTLGLTIDILFPEHSLISLAEKKLIDEMQKYYKKWRVLTELSPTTPIKDKLFENILTFSDTLKNHLITNPSHMYWNILMDSGFPFIKKELLTLNPIGYPFPYQFRQTFEKYAATEFLKDLPGTVKAIRVV